MRPVCSICAMCLWMVQTVGWIAPRWAAMPGEQVTRSRPARPAQRCSRLRCPINIRLHASGADIVIRVGNIDRTVNGPAMSTQRSFIIQMQSSWVATDYLDQMQIFTEQESVIKFTGTGVQALSVNKLSMHHCRGIDWTSGQPGEGWSGRSGWLFFPC